MRDALTLQRSEMHRLSDTYTYDLLHVSERSPRAEARSGMLQGGAVLMASTH